MARPRSVKPAMTLTRLVDKFRSEDKCRAYLEELRWPDGVRCPRCQSTKISRIVKRNQFDCDSCRYQFSVTAGTIFAHSHFPLWEGVAGGPPIWEARHGVAGHPPKPEPCTTHKTPPSFFHPQPAP